MRKKGETSCVLTAKATPGGIWLRFPLQSFGNYQRNVVSRRGASGEFRQSVGYGVHDHLRRLQPVARQDLDKPLFAELVVVGVGGLGHAIAIENQQFSG